MLYTLRQLLETAGSVQVQINGKWVPARPLPFESSIRRMKAAWLVLTGKADAFIWPEGQ